MESSDLRADKQRKLYFPSRQQGINMKRLFVFSAVVLLSCGCSTTTSSLPSWMPGSAASTDPGQQMLSQAKETKELGKTWNEGQRLVDKGQKLLAKSDKLSREAQKAKAEAEGLIAEGEGLISNSETGYRTAFGSDSSSFR